MNISTTCSASFQRIIPWSMKTQVSLSPMALCTSTAATDESTPPDRPRIALSVGPTCSRMRCTCSSMIDAGVHVGVQSQAS